MNNERRKAIDEAISKLEHTKSAIEDIASEERESFDNLSEGLQQSERGQSSEQAADALDQAVMSFDDILNNLEEAKG